MLGELGHMALILALVMSAVQIVVPTIGLVRQDMSLMAVARTSAYLQAVLITTAFVALMAGFILSDFSILNVFENSHSAKPMLYKIAGTWGNHEGSLLLWALILCGFSAAVAHYGTNLPAVFQTRVLVIQGGIVFGFLLFALLTSNPFQRLFPIPLEGEGLNPLLQDPGLAFHPPFLYVGYVGFSIAFSFAIAALWEGRVGPDWARWVRPWTLVAWVFLSIGIMLGALWAYYELGWGGWWFWDPVENASLLPWLSGTALLHSAIVVEKRDALKAWTVLLAIVTFSLSLLGTFLVRSGVLTSVHAFAVDPERGVFILIYLLVVTGGALALYAYRAAQLRPTGSFKPLSREGFLVLNNALLSAAAAVVLLGTLYPLFLDAISGQKITVGPPYFNKTVLPLLAPLMVTMVVATALPWKRGKFGDVRESLKIAMVGAILMFGVVVLVFGLNQALAALGAAVGLWVVLGAGADWAKRVRFDRGSFNTNGLHTVLRRSLHLPASAWGVILAHCGVGVMIIAVSVSEAGSQSYVGRVNPGEAVAVGGYTFTVTDLQTQQGPNFTQLTASVEAQHSDGWQETLFPGIRSYTQPPMTTTEAAISLLWMGHVYVAVGDLDVAEQTVGLRIQIKPMMSWLWWGTLIMVIGGLLSLSDRRLRVGAPRARTKPVSPVPAE